MAKEPRFHDNPGMMTNISFFAIALVNLVVISLANMWFPQNVVMGTVDMSPTWAAIMFSGAVALLAVAFLPFLTVYEKRIGRTLSMAELIGIFSVFNFVAVWLVTRKSEIFGVGVTSWVVVLFLAIALDFLQGMVMSSLENWRARK